MGLYGYGCMICLQLGISFFYFSSLQPLFCLGAGSYKFLKSLSSISSDCDMKTCIKDFIRNTLGTRAISKICFEHWLKRFETQFCIFVYVCIIMQNYTHIIIALHRLISAAQHSTMELWITIFAKNSDYIVIYYSPQNLMSSKTTSDFIFIIVYRIK